jgi:hypothetical protein
MTVKVVGKRLGGDAAVLGADTESGGREGTEDGFGFLGVDEERECMNGDEGIGEILMRLW